MMFRTILITAFAIFLGNMAVAQPIPIASGEHQGYTRLVFEGRNLQGWSHQQDGRTHRVRLPDHQDGFQTRSIYQRIQKDRVASFDASASVFSFDLACNCEVEVFAIGNTVLVVDVKDSDGDAPPQVARSPLENFEDVAQNAGTRRFGFGKKLGQTPPLPRGVQPSALRQATLPQQDNDQDNDQENDFAQSEVEAEPVAVSQAPIVIAPQPIPERVQNEVDLAQVAQDEQRAAPQIDTDLLPQPRQALRNMSADQSDILRAAQNRLLEEFGAASTRGVITPRMLEGAFGDGVSRPQVDVRIFDSSEQVLDEVEASIPSGNLRITSSTDIALSQRTEAAVTTSGYQCIDPARLDLLSWGDTETSFDSQVGEIRRNLFGEFDEMNAQAAVKLARLYIYFGFGAEARVTLMMDPEIAAKWPELLDIAAILERGHARNPRVMQHYADCESAAALWSLLALKTIEGDMPFDKRAALLALNSLPAHLRAFLAPELSKRFLEFGDQVAASDAMRSLERLTTPVTDQAIMAQADLVQAQGDSAQAEQLLEDVVDSNSEYSAEALIALVEADLEAGRPIDRETADLIEAYATELRDAPISADLRRIQVLALAKSGQFNAAYAALQKLEPTIEPELADTMRAKLLSHVTEDAEDIEFMNILFSQLPHVADIKNKVPLLESAQRLQYLGFPEVAEQVLEDGAVTSTKREAKVLRAMIALDLNRPSEAEAHILTLSGPDIDVLRARAKELNGERIQAHDLYTLAEKDPNAQANAWLSEDWKTLTDPDAPVIGPLARIASQELDRSLETEGMLARSQGLLDESADTRSVILDALRMDPS